MFKRLKQDKNNMTDVDEINKLNNQSNNGNETIKNINTNDVDLKNDDLINDNENNENDKDELNDNDIFMQLNKNVYDTTVPHQPINPINNNFDIKNNIKHGKDYTNN